MLKLFLISLLILLNGCISKDSPEYKKMQQRRLVEMGCIKHYVDQNVSFKHFSGDLTEGCRRYAKQVVK